MRASCEWPCDQGYGKIFFENTVNLNATEARINARYYGSV